MFDKLLDNQVIDQYVADYRNRGKIMLENLYLPD